MGKKGFFSLLAASFKEWQKDNSEKLAASIAFFGFISIAPMVGVILALSSKITGLEVSKQETESIVAGVFHPKIVSGIRELMLSGIKMDENEVISLTVLSFFAMIFGAGQYAEGILFSVETIWNKRRAESGLKAKLKDKAKSLVIILVIMIIWIAGLTGMFFFPELRQLGEGSDAGEILLWPVRNIIPFLIYFLISYFIFFYAPPVKLRWFRVLPGALLAAVLQLSGKGLLTAYFDLKGSDEVSIAESLLLMMAWMFFMSAVLLYAAEFSRMYIQSREKFDVNEG